MRVRVHAAVSSHEAFVHAAARLLVSEHGQINLSGQVLEVVSFLDAFARQFAVVAVFAAETDVRLGAQRDHAFAAKLDFELTWRAFVVLVRVSAACAHHPLAACRFRVHEGLFVHGTGQSGEPLVVAVVVLVLQARRDALVEGGASERKVRTVRVHFDQFVAVARQVALHELMGPLTHAQLRVAVHEHAQMQREVEDVFAFVEFDLEEVVVYFPTRLESRLVYEVRGVEAVGVDGVRLFEFVHGDFAVSRVAHEFERVRHDFGIGVFVALPSRVADFVGKVAEAGFVVGKVHGVMDLGDSQSEFQVVLEERSDEQHAVRFVNTTMVY